MSNPIYVVPPRSVETLTIGQNNSSGNTQVFIGLGDVTGVQASTTESNVDIQVDFSFTVRRLRLVVQANTKDANSVFAFRDDTANIGATTVGAGATGEFDSGAVADFVAAGSKCNFRIDRSLSSMGAITSFMLVVIEYT